MSDTKQTITAVIPTLNEEKNITRCIKSLQWCDHIVVLDSGTDTTAETAKGFGAEVINCHESGSSEFIALQKNINLASENAQTNWILRVDADEVVEPALQHEIEKILHSDQTSVAFGIPRKQYFWGGFLKGGDWAYDRLVRLYRKGYAQYDLKSHVHEQFKVNGKVGYLTHHLLHYSHPTLDVAISKFNKYTSIEIKDYNVTRTDATIKMFLLPPYIFLRWMIWNRGYRDGIRGLVAGIMRAWYEFILYAKYIEKLT